MGRSPSVSRYWILGDPNIYKTTTDVQPKVCDIELELEEIRESIRDVNFVLTDLMNSMDRVLDCLDLKTSTLDTVDNTP